MLRRLVPGLLLLALSAAAPFALAAEDSPSLDDLVQQSLARDASGRRKTDMTGSLPGVALAGPIDPATYLLGPGDQLVVLWTGRVSRTDRVEVGPTGDLFLSEIGTMHVSGRTLAAARTAILDRMRLVTRDVRVDVQLTRPRRFSIYLSGAVLDPGPVEAMGGSRVSDILQVSAIRPGGSTRNILVQRRDGSRELADLERVLRTGDHARDTWLTDGDAIVVPWIQGHVFISGAVPAAGVVEFRADDSLSIALRLVGGLRPDAAPDAAQWLHWSGGAAPETLSIDVHEVVTGRRDVALALGDRVFVRALPGFRISAEVHVEGDVARPGGYPVATTGTRLSAVLAAAGGLLPSADSSGILIRLRPDVMPLDDKERELRAKMLEKDMAVSDFEVNRAQHSSQNGEVFVNLRSDRNSESPPPDPLLRDGDLVQVRRLVNALRIDGQVVNPGVLAYQPGLSLGDYVDQAGGLTGTAWKGHEQVTRAGSSQTQLARSVELRPGDVVWVPTKPQGSWWERSGQLLFVLAQLATIALAVRSLR